MTKRLCLTLGILTLLGGTPIANRRALGADRPRNYADEGKKIIENRCYQCHSGKTLKGGLDLSVRDSLVKPAGKSKKIWVVEGKSKDSAVFGLIEGDKARMPEDDPGLPEEELKVLRGWIDSGFEFLAPAVVKDVQQWATREETLDLIENDLRSHLFSDRKFQRYFTLANVFNRVLLDKTHPEADPSKELRRYQDGLTQTLNCLSWEKDFYRPRALGNDGEKKGIVMAVDLRELNWTPELWNQLFTRDDLGRGNTDAAKDGRPTLYPYYLDYEKYEGSVKVAKAIAELSRDPNNTSEVIVDPLYVRADWFIANVTRPPLYQIALRLPNTVEELERRLGVDVASNLLDAAGVRVIRAGFDESGVSQHNRVVERHVSLFGAYWKSYDFKGNRGNEEIRKKPFGPVMKDNPFPDKAFEHAGGEMIFNLPNGLQGYYLSDNKGNPLDSGPIEIVFNKEHSKVTGNQTIVNGLSCMSCHWQGIRDFKNDITAESFDKPEEIEYGPRLYPPQSTLDRKVAEDKSRYFDALKSLFPSRYSDQKELGPDLVSTLAEKFLEPLGIEEIASETDQSNLENLKNQMSVMTLDGQRLSANQSIKRTEWESATRTVTMFQSLCAKLRVGSPRAVNKVSSENN